jgi:AcrR family transcriptional regulator
MPRTSRTGVRRPPLTRDEVLRAAVDLADRSGIERLSMRALAAHVGVEAMSLYHHVAGKEALLDGMVDLVFDEIHTPEVGGEWREEMRRRSLSGREVMARHPWAIGLMDSRRTPGLATLRHHDAVIGCLRAAGFSVALTGHAFALLDAHLYGHMVQETGMPFEGGDDVTELAEGILDGLPDGELVHFRAFTTELVLQPGYDFRNEFEVGLDLILDGLAERLEAETVRAR